MCPSALARRSRRPRTWRGGCQARSLRQVGPIAWRRFCVDDHHQVVETALGGEQRRLPSRASFISPSRGDAEAALARLQPLRSEAPGHPPPARPWPSGPEVTLEAGHVRVRQALHAGAVGEYLSRSAASVSQPSSCRQALLRHHAVASREAPDSRVRRARGIRGRWSEASTDRAPAISMIDKAHPGWASGTGEGHAQGQRGQARIKAFARGERLS